MTKQRFLFLFFQLGSFLYMKLGGYKLWSSIHRKYFDSQYDEVPVSTYNTIEELAGWIQSKAWVEDSWPELFDAVCTPNKVEAVGQQEGAKIGDCDEFAIYLSTAIKKSLANDLMKESGISNPRFLTVMWFNPETNKAGGHNVCLLDYVQKADGSTWHAYMDYGMPSAKASSVQGVVDMVRRKYAPECIPLTYCVSDTELTPELVVLG